jgi:hypothetical protein
VSYQEQGDDVCLVFQKRMRGRWVVQMRGVEGTRESDHLRQAQDTRAWIARIPSRSEEYARQASQETYQHLVELPYGSAPHWAKVAEAGTSMVTAAYGWPFPALMIWSESPWLRSQHQSISWVPTSWRPTRSHRIFGRSTATTPLTLPLLPVSLGFLLDSLMYASAWWLVIVAPRLAIRARPRRRGLCPTCAYDAAGAPTCPECGSSLDPRHGDDDRRP